jgi:hypothetical protein
MAAVRRLWWVVILGLLATAGLACSSGTSEKAGTSGSQNGSDTQRGSTGEEGAVTPQKAGEPVRVQDTDPGVDGTPCEDCQSADDRVKLSDADGFEFETGEAEAGRIDAGEPAEGDEKPATFDAGQGMTGTTGSSNLKPK